METDDNWKDLQHDDLAAMQVVAQNDDNYQHRILDDRHQIHAVIPYVDLSLNQLIVLMVDPQFVIAYYFVPSINERPDQQVNDDLLIVQRLRHYLMIAVDVDRMSINIDDNQDFLLNYVAFVVIRNFDYRQWQRLVMPFAAYLNVNENMIMMAVVVMIQHNLLIDLDRLMLFDHHRHRSFDLA